VADVQRPAAYRRRLLHRLSRCVIATIRETLAAGAGRPVLGIIARPAAA
jgi:hypothetical protein